MRLGERRSLCSNASTTTRVEQRSHRLPGAGGGYERRFLDRAKVAVMLPPIIRSAPNVNQIKAIFGTDLRCSAKASIKHSRPSAATVMPIPIMASADIDGVRDRRGFPEASIVRIGR